MIGDGMGAKVMWRESGRPARREIFAGVRAVIVAKKCRNGHGVKGSREAET